MSNLKDKNVVVTGGNRGIGKAIALAFGQEGANVIITYHSDRKLAEQVVETLKSMDVKAQKIKVDLKEETQRNELVEQCYQFGDIDILINNAGVAGRNAFLKLSNEEIRSVFEVNLMAPLFLMQSFGRKMVSVQQDLVHRGQDCHDYCIINITSICQTVIIPGLSHYEASKSALNQLSKSTAIDLAKYNIRVNCIAPGLIPTDLNRKIREDQKLWEKRVSSTPLNRAGTPEEIASGAVFIANHAWMTGTTLNIDGGRSNNWEGTNISHDIFSGT